MRRLSRAQRGLTEGSARELVVVAFAVPVVTMVVTVFAVAAVLLFAGNGFDGLGTTVGAVWLAIHQVPVTISGVTIGVLPLLPTLLVGAFTARMAASAAGSERAPSELIAVLFSAIGGPVLMTALSLAVVMDGASVTQIQSPPALPAFGYTLGLHAAAAAIGIGWRRRRDAYARFTVTPADRRGVRLGVVAVLALMACAALLVVARLILRWHVLGTLIADGNDFDGYLGLTMLSVLYLPNIVVAAASVLIGADAHVGTASVNLGAVHPGQLPSLPVLAVMPDSSAGLAGLLGLVVPAGIALLVALRCRDVDPVANVRSVGIAAAVAASIMVALSAMSGGALGEFGDAGVTIPTVGVFTLGWIMVVGLVVALIHGCLPSTRAARADADDQAWDEDQDESDDGYDDEYLTDEYLTDDHGDEFGDDYVYEYDFEDEYKDEYDDAVADADPDDDEPIGDDEIDDVAAEPARPQN